MFKTNQISTGTTRKNARIAGILLIIGTVSGVLSVTLSGQFWNAPDYLQRLSANQTLVNYSILLQFIMAIACAAISFPLYPIIKKYSPGLAIGTVGFRLVENTLQILKAVSMIALLTLSREFIQAGSPTGAYFQSLGAIISAGSDWMINGAGLICFSIGASMYYFIFYQYKLAPRWLSGWGMASLALTILSSLLVMAKIIPGFGFIQVVANLSIALQEMVFAAWLIVKGVNSYEAVSAVNN